MTRWVPSDRICAGISSQRDDVTLSCSHQVFGLKLVEIDTKNHMYILVNRLERAEGPVR